MFHFEILPDGESKREDVNDKLRPSQGLYIATVYQDIFLTVKNILENICGHYLVNRARFELAIR